MVTKKRSLAKKQYRVYATQIVFQDVEAETAEEAFWIADEEPLFEPCESCCTLDPDVKDLETDEFIRVGSGTGECKTCGSEITASIHDSNFHDGECGGCEYQRYQSHPDLLAACFMAQDEIKQWDDVMGGSEDSRTKEAIAVLRAAIRKAHGKAN